MESHPSHPDNIINNGVFNMRRCQICNEPIWESNEEFQRGKFINKFICSFCFSTMKEGKYKPTLSNKSSLFVCDKCGETVDRVVKTDEGMICEYCME
jgi:formylmethanofuran dehydrogenase subunit E